MFVRIILRAFCQRSWRFSIICHMYLLNGLFRHTIGSYLTRWNHLKWFTWQYIIFVCHQIHYWLLTSFILFLKLIDVVEIVYLLMFIVASTWRNLSNDSNNRFINLVLNLRRSLSQYEFFIILRRHIICLHFLRSILLKISTYLSKAILILMFFLLSS